MKNLSIVLNVVLLIAVIILYILHFRQPQPTSSSKPVTILDMKKDTLPTITDIAQIAYVNTDTLMANYAYYKTTEQLMKSKRQKLEQEINGRGRALQNELVAYQQKRNSMTVEEIQQAEQLLTRKDAELQQYSNKVSTELAKEEQAKTDELLQKISDYLKKYTQDKPYKYVFAYTKGASAILYAQENLDITADVLKGLNEEYKANKK